MEVTAKARFIRMSPRKVRLVADLVRGLDVTDALAQLKFVRKAAVRPVTKLIESAVANATHNHQLDASSLYIKMIAVDDGPTLKRWRARAHGRAASIHKRTSHISVILDVRGADDVGVAAAVVKTSADKGEKTVSTKAKAGSAKADKVEKKPVKKATRAAKAGSAATGKGESKTTASAKKANKDE
jgi:large subunit ribosomal protein L22